MSTAYPYSIAGAANALYQTPSRSPGSTRPRPKPRAKTYEAVTAWQRREMVDLSRVIAHGVPNIREALIQAGEFSIGDSWFIKTRGADKAWGKKRDEWFNQIFARNCNLRGPQNDWRSSLRQFNWTRKVEADYAVWFDGSPRKDPVTGKELTPSGQFGVIKFDRIATGLAVRDGAGIVSVGNGLEAVHELPKQLDTYLTATSAGVPAQLYVIDDPASPFDGERIIDGIILDSQLRVLGYRILGYTADGRPTYADIPAAKLHFNFSAREELDLIRGIPELASKILPVMHLDDIQVLVSMAVKLASALAITRKSTDGRPNTGVTYSQYQTQDASGNTVTKTTSVQDIYPGIVELATNNKEELGALDFNRPTMNEESFIKRVETSVLHTLWPRDLIYPDATGRAGTRAIGVQANTICTWDQCCVERTARWIADRATEFAMRAGYIPALNNLAAPYEYAFTVPAKFTVDEGNDMKMRLLALGRCCISRGQIVELEGYLAEEIEEQREAETERLMAAAKRLNGKHPEFSVKECLHLLDTGDSNISYTESVAPSNQPPAEPAAAPK